MSEVFNPHFVGFARTHALAEGELVDANHGELAPVSREHFPEHRLALTRAAFDFLVAHADTDDLAGVWHHVLLMAHIRQVRLFAGGNTFEIGLRVRGVLRWHELKIRFHRGDCGESCATVMLPEED